MLIVNCRFLSQRITGTQRFAIEICRELKRQEPDILFVSNPNIIHPELAKELEIKVIGKVSYKIFKALKLPSGLLWEQVILPFYIKKYFPHAKLLNLVNLAPVFYDNNYVVLHDVAYKVFPQFFNKVFLVVYNILVPLILRKSKMIFTVSHFSKSEIESYYPETSQKIEVIYNALSDDIKSRHIREEPPYILTVGSLEPRKNLISLINAFQKREDKNVKLMIVGDKNSKVFNTENYTIEDDSIVFTGYISEEEKNTLYQGASLFVYPSLYEGFGIPPLEAQNYGIPVILSDIPVFREVYGDSAEFVDPLNTEVLIATIENLLKDSIKVESLVEKGYKNVKTYSWQKSAKKILTCLK